MTAPRPAPLQGDGARGVSRGYDQVVAYLGEKMASGLLKPGDRLLPERELALHLNISRPVLREAMRALAMIGVVDMQQGRGTFVRTPELASLGHFFSFLLNEQDGPRDDVMQVRQALERQAIRLACTRARDEDFERIEDALRLIRATIDDPETGGRADFQFHTRIVEASHSPALIQIYAIVARMLERNHVRRRRRIAARARFQDYIIDHHARLFEAVRARDPEAGERLLTAHFRIGDELSNEAPPPQRAAAAPSTTSGEGTRR